MVRLLLMCAAHVLASPALDSRRESEQMRRTGAEIESLLVSLAPRLERIEEFQERFPDPRAPVAYPPARSEQHAPLQAGLLRGWELLRELQAQRRIYRTARSAEFVRRIYAGGDDSVAADIAGMYASDGFDARATETLQRIQHALTIEFTGLNERRAAEEEAAKVRRWARRGAAAAAVLLALLLGAGWLMSRWDRPVPIYVVAAPPAGPQPQLPAPPPRAALPAPGPGSVVGGRFLIERALPAGPFGPVFAARDPDTRREVRVTRVRDELHGSERDLDRFLERARRVSLLQHPGIAEVLAVLLDGGRVHLVGERVAGRALRELLGQRRAFPLPETKRLMRQALVALAFAHGKGAAHGGLSPDCIFVEDDGYVKVADFGIGIEAARAAAKLNWSASFGTTAYLAPEQELGTVYKESDGFSAGAVFYELLTGRPAFPGPDFLAQKRAGRFAPPSALLPGLAPAADEFCAKALAPEPASRYRGIERMLAAMELIPETPGQDGMVL